MATVDQLLRQLARRSGDVPYWVLEKDYALSYLLAGIVATPVLHNSLTLKGGTALRKGYFADYRFSEDLDFSLRPNRSLPDVDTAVRHAVRQMEQLLLQRGPFEASVERLTLREPHPGSQDAFSVQVRFPTQRQALCRLKIEITRDELVVLPPATRPLLHSYPEELAVALWCYPLEEIVAEKLRALLQSGRVSKTGDGGVTGLPRLLRSVADLHRNELRPGSLPPLVLEKCRHRNIVLDEPELILCA
ncbi:MAG: nucleotidyl transferase AbiEii/AbiGii toxin family protein [Caldilineales bacterium]